MLDIIERMRQFALPDPHDEREVLHASLLQEAADTIESLCEKLDKANQLELGYFESKKQLAKDVNALQQQLIQKCIKQNTQS